MKYLLLSLLLFFSCRKSEKLQLTDIPAEKHGADSLLPVNRYALPYNHVDNDTITEDGWKIQYLANNDPARRSDIYIRASKNHIEKISTHPGVADMRFYFVPSYVSETGNYLLFKHGCATDCTAITVVPKNEKGKAITFEWVLKYDLEQAIVVFIKNIAEGPVCISAYDLDSNTEKTVTFKNRCISLTSMKCISNVLIKHDKVEITGWFNDQYGENSIKEIQTITF